MKKSQFLRTDEQEDAVRSLEWSEQQARNVSKNIHIWKWVLISLHQAAQGFMILALWKGNGLLALKDDNAKEWLTAYREGMLFPEEKLDSFLNLYKKVKRKKHLQLPFQATASHDHSLRCLNEYRNEFIHFAPKGWSLGLSGLPKICLDASDLIKYLGFETEAILWHKKKHQTSGARALRRFRRQMTELNKHYEQ